MALGSLCSYDFGGVYSGHFNTPVILQILFTVIILPNQLKCRNITAYKTLFDYDGKIGIFLFDF